MLLGVWPCLSWAQAQGIVLRSSPRLQEQLSPAESRQGAMLLDAGRVEMRPDMDARLEGGVVLRKPDLVLRAEIPGISAEKFAELAQFAKENCPVSKALAGCEITLDAALK